MEAFEIIILDVPYLYKKNYFDHISVGEKQDITKRLEEKTSIIVGLINENKDIKYCVVYDFMDDTIHIRECSIKALKHYFYIEAFATALAKFYKKRNISMSTIHDKVEKILLKRNFKKDKFGDFIKNVEK